MARLIRWVQKTLLSASIPVSKTLIHGLQNHPCAPSVRSRDATSAFFFQFRRYANDVITKSPFDANILRILRTEIDYQSEYAPPYAPAAKFNSFTVEDRAGEQWLTMNRKFGENEEIKIEVTMFDGLVSVPKVGDDSTGEDARLHISVIVDISKGDGSDALEFVCSAWPDALEIHKVYVLGRDNNLARPYMGPHFGNWSGELRKRFLEYLEERGASQVIATGLGLLVFHILLRWGPFLLKGGRVDCICYLDDKILTQVRSLTWIGKQVLEGWTTN